MEWTPLAHDVGEWLALVNTVVNVQSGAFSEYQRSFCFSRRAVLRAVVLLLSFVPVTTAFFFFLILNLYAEYC